MKKIIHTEKAPKAVGPYSQAVEVNNTLYVSGQLAIDPTTGKLVSDDVQEQTQKALENICAILEAAQYTIKDVVKSTVLLKDIKDFALVNEVYARFYTSEMPARVCYEVANLPLGARVEIETIAAK